MRKVQAVTFDLAGTLLHPKPSVGAVYARCAKELGVECDPLRLERDFPLAFRTADRTKPVKEFWHDVVVRCFGPTLPSSLRQAVFEACWSAFGRPEAWRLSTGARQALAAVRFLGLKTAVLSNADGRMRAVMDGHGLTPFFDDVFLSDETGKAKPDPAAFSGAAKSLGVPISALVHVGDSTKEDAEAARDSGATGMLLGGAAPERCLSAATLRDVPLAVRAILTQGRSSGKFSRTVANLLAELSGLPKDRSRSSDRPIKTIDEAVREAVSKLRLDRPVPETAIVAHWAELLPSRLARRCAPLKVLEGGKLTVQCENAVVRSEAKFHERAMLAKIRALPGCAEVRSIAFISA